VCIALGRIVPGVAHVTKWPYELVGAGYGVLGVAFILVAHLRVRAVESALQRGEFLHMDDRLLVILLGAGVVLGAASVALVVFGG
jgi:hypothetical protein